jgi:hypothetical protein
MDPHPDPDPHKSLNPDPIRIRINNPAKNIYLNIICDGHLTHSCPSHLSDGGKSLLIYTKLYF